MFSDLKEALHLTGSSHFIGRAVGLSATVLHTEDLCGVFMWSRLLCRNSSLAASSFSGFGPED